VSTYTVQIEELAQGALDAVVWFDVFRIAHRAQAEDLARDLAAVVGASRVRLQVVEDRRVRYWPALASPVDDCRCGHGRSIHTTRSREPGARFECVLCECLHYQKAGT
jgi:CRISPR/Cas system endoribonuclease Cas6 (RAMP superfamily)